MNKLIIEKFNSKYPRVLRLNAFNWWLKNQDKRINSSFFNSSYASLKKRRVLACFLNEKKYYSFLRTVKRGM